MFAAGVETKDTIERCPVRTIRVPIGIVARHFFKHELPSSDQLPASMTLCRA